MCAKSVIAMNKKATPPKGLTQITNETIACPQPHPGLCVAVVEDNEGNSRRTNPKIISLMLIRSNRFRPTLSRQKVGIRMGTAFKTWIKRIEVSFELEEVMFAI
ncbi:hypothetical protein NL676_039699 [Syzygium grande]|nr:hypothetical protein NL676_039699 [Syzygium grande]